ncbi:hypothetical protein Tco_1468449 [Tanacetum coccineum]
MIPPVFSSFYNNPYLKDVQAFYAKELPISSSDPITPPAILTPSLVLPPSLLFDPRYFFVPEELLPPKKRICSPSSSSTTLSNPSRNQTCDLCAEEDRVTFATGTLTDDALSWWNAYAQLIGIEQANKITWIELKRLLTNKYCPRTEVKKMEDGILNWLSIEGNVTASKPQTLEEAINIAQRLMDQIIKHDSMQEANDRRKESRTFRTYTATKGYMESSSGVNDAPHHHRPWHVKVSDLQ